MDECVHAFLDAIASDDVAPAGGSGAAISGAIGVALCEMAVIQSDTDILKRSTFGDARTQLLELADADATVIDEVFGSRSDSITDAEYRRALDVPLSIARVSLSVLEQAAPLLAVDDANTTPDVITGCLLIGAACEASCATALANCEAIDDTTTDSETEVRQLRAQAVSHLDSIRLHAGLEPV